MTSVQGAGWFVDDVSGDVRAGALIAGVLVREAHRERELERTFGLVKLSAATAAGITVVVMFVGAVVVPEGHVQGSGTCLL